MGLLENRLVVSLLSIVLTLIVQQLVKRRGLFTYSVRHSKVGVSADDAVFGRVQVTWYDTPVAHLYASTVELRNESLKDYENVTVTVYTNDTQLLTEQSEIVGTTHTLRWTKEFQDQLAVESGARATQQQQALYNKRREYLLPTMNRSQIVRVTYLNAATTDKQPSLWVDIVHKGVKVKIRTPQIQFMGVPQRTAVIVGSVLGMLVLGAAIQFIDTIWIAAAVGMSYGLMVRVSGAVCMRLWRWLRASVGG